MKRLGMAVLVLAVAAGLVPGKAFSETVFSLFGGQATTRNHNLTINQEGKDNYLVFHDVAFDDESYAGPIYYGFRVSHFFQNHPHMGVELEFFHPKAIADVDQKVRVDGTYHGEPVDEKAKMKKYVQDWEISHGFNFLLVNFAYRYGFFKTEKVPYGRLQLIGRVGAGPNILHPESRVDGEVYYIDKGGYELGNLGFQVSPGVEFNIWRGVNGFLEYKYTYAQIDHATIKYGDSETVFISDHFAFGLAYHFK